MEQLPTCLSRADLTGELGTLRAFLGERLPAGCHALARDRSRIGCAPRLFKAKNAQLPEPNDFRAKHISNCPAVIVATQNLTEKEIQKRCSLGTYFNFRLYPAGMAASEPYIVTSFFFELSQHVENASMSFKTIANRIRGFPGFPQAGGFRQS